MKIKERAFFFYCKSASLFNAFTATIFCLFSMFFIDLIGFHLEAKVYIHSPFLIFVSVLIVHPVFMKIAGHEDWFFYRKFLGLFIGPVVTALSVSLFVLFQVIKNGWQNHSDAGLATLVIVGATSPITVILGYVLAHINYNFIDRKNTVGMNNENQTEPRHS